VGKYEGHPGSEKSTRDRERPRKARASIGDYTSKPNGPAGDRAETGPTTAAQLGRRGGRLYRVAEKHVGKRNLEKDLVSCTAEGGTTRPKKTSVTQKPSKKRKKNQREEGYGDDFHGPNYPGYRNKQDTGLPGDPEGASFR